MSPTDHLTILALSHVSFGMSGARRFILSMAAKSPDAELTPRQRWYLWFLAWRYRRQLPREIADMALESYAGAAAPDGVVRVRARVDRRSLVEEARRVVASRLRFGDPEQIRALRYLARRGYRGRSRG